MSDSIECTPLETRSGGAAFRIVESHRGAVRTGIAADAATCPACLADMRDPANRRYRYPFTDCTPLRPRLSMVRAIPYDRATTSMAKFAMCPACLAEYRDPADRRFHAQPNACPECGPKVWLEGAAGSLADTSAYRDAIETAAALIDAGEIVAIKGIGGFHLACDACNPGAVARLRERKARFGKPFALMARDLAIAAEYAEDWRGGADAADGVAAPIAILIEARTSAAAARRIAPGQSTLGFMLPYTPLHHLLLENFGRPIVLTSGNRSDEPQCVDNEEARDRLSTIADYFLMHDRDIVNRLDDSVARVMAGAPRLLRRARGYAPTAASAATGLRRCAGGAPDGC